MREMFCFVECKDQIEEDMLNESFLEVINIRPKKKKISLTVTEFLK